VVWPQNYWDDLLVVWPQNHWGGFSWFGLKTGGGRFPSLGLKTCRYSLGFGSQNHHDGFLVGSQN
jgi:hypothetical protein